MEPRQRWSVIVTLVLLVSLWWYHTGSTRSGFEDRHLGTWTDPAGPPGNFLKFELVWKDLPGAPMSVGEGVVTAKHFLGQDAFTGNWNFENYNGPIRLNVSAGKRGYIVAVEHLPDGRLRLAFHDHFEQAHGPDALQGPTVKVLTRIADAVPPAKAQQ
jgi:hypothetical protein